MTGTIVLTGATSGFGAAALDILLAMTDAPIIIGARNVESAATRFGKRVQVQQLDLASMESVQKFCEGVRGQSIQMLGLNAGMQTRTLALTEDGYETTFQTNYLSHFLMLQRLKDQLTKNALIVTTGSGTHDPAEKTPVPSPRHANVDWLAYPDREPSPDRFTPIRLARAYSTSKLLCILMAMEIPNRMPGMQAISFDPGYLPDTSLAREYPSFLMAIIKLLIPRLMKNDRSGSVSTTAPEYARVLTGELSPDSNGGYIVMRSGKGIEALPSELARQDGLAAEVWDKSLHLLSIRT